MRWAPGTVQVTALGSVWDVLAALCPPSTAGSQGGSSSSPQSRRVPSPAESLAPPSPQLLPHPGSVLVPPLLGAP